ncbi:MAG: hypothetical protein AAGD15_01670 [Agrobacterium cavarae]|uniref:hypothetical protein n=1 Tax=Agrobacterium cavarae TaxID=2528239 RepID=UPI0031AD60DB
MWNTDITAAPRGEEKATTTIVDGKERTKREYHVAPVWLAFADGKVKRSYWVPEANGFPSRWSGCTAAETPIAWQHFVVPEHPFTTAPGDAAVTLGNVLRKPAAAEQGQNIREGDAPRETNRASGDASGPDTAQFYLEDVGGGE